MKRARGITLVALVVTILIIVILASVTISATFGKHGIIKKSELARDLASNVTIEEAEDMNSLMDEYANIMSEDGGIPEPPKDTTPPTVNIQVGTVTENSIQIIVIATDDSGEIAKYVYHINGKKPQESTTNTYKYDGLIAGTEYTIKVEVFDKANNKGEKTITVSTNRKPGDGAGEIEKNPTAYYGSEVRGYTCASQGVSKWRIFYADSTNIYLIADYYISYQYAPKGKNGSAIYKNSTDWKLSFSNVVNDYTGASWINSNSKGKKWLNQFLSKYSTSTNYNVQAVAYMMDTNVWSTYAGADAEYAIGGPTLEMFCESYKDTHPTKYIECQASDSTGYKVRWKNGSWGYFVNELIQDDFNKIYINSDASKADGMWLASPSAYNSGQVVRAYDYGGVGYNHYYNRIPGLRPLICLKSTVQLEKVSEGVYQIVK